MQDDFIDLSKNQDDPETQNDDPASIQPTLEDHSANVANNDNKSKKPLKDRIKAWLKYEHKDLSKKQWVILISVLVALVAVGTASALYLYRHLSYVEPLPYIQSTKHKPRKVPSPLTGVEVMPKLAKRPITGIMIENSPDARPQSGLLQAGVVYEAIAEGGITRFLALYQETKPSYIGPVRSARPYFLDFVLPFNASLAHVGGSPDALKAIKTKHVRDLDQFFNPSAYWRISQRYAPHNMYTSMAKLDALKRSKGFKLTKFDSFPRKLKENPAKHASAKNIDFSISGYYYDVHYTYDKKSNSYMRKEGGAKHVDDRSKRQLHPKVVIALVMDYGLASDGHHSVYGTTGSGIMYVFQDGRVTQGTWHKSGSKSQIKFKNSKGENIGLNAGQTWITLLGSKNDITYKP